MKNLGTHLGANEDLAAIAMPHIRDVACALAPEKLHLTVNMSASIYSRENPQRLYTDQPFDIREPVLQALRVIAESLQSVGTELTASYHMDDNDATLKGSVDPGWSAEYFHYGAELGVRPPTFEEMYAHIPVDLAEYMTLSDYESDGDSGRD